MGDSRVQVDRRDFLKRAAALGASAAAPIGLLGACGGGDDAEPQQRELHDLHFDFSAAPLDEPRLIALRSDSHNRLLQVHDVQSRARHRAINPALASVSDAQLTHYLERVDLPAKALQGLLVMGHRPGQAAGSNSDVLAAAQVFVPSAARHSVEQRAARLGSLRTSAKQQHYGVTTRGAGDVPREDLRDLVSAWDVAVYLVFHHPEVMNLDIHLGGEILDRIESLPCAPDDTACIPVLGNLVFKIALLVSTKGYPGTTPGSWATLVQMTDIDGKLLYDERNQPLYRYDLDDDIARATGEVVKVILKDIFDDHLFEGTNWHAPVAVAMQQGGAALPSRVGLRVASAAAGFRVEAAHPPGSVISGIGIVSVEVTNEATREVTVEVRNTFLRYVSVYVEFRDGNLGADHPDGQLLLIDAPGDLDTDTSRCLGMAPTNADVMGIPLQGNMVDSVRFTFTIPDAASSATLKFCSLGLGGDAFGPEATIGSALTLAVNIALPTMTLAAGVTVDVKFGKSFGSLSFANSVDNPLKAILIAFARALAGSGTNLASSIQASASENSLTRWITGVANVVLQALFEAAPTFAADVLGEIVFKAGLNGMLGPVGVALKVLAVIASALEVAVSVTEILCSKAITTNKIALSMDTTLRVSRDSSDFQFPASARRWEALAYYDGGTVPRKLAGAMPQGQVDPLDIVFAGVPCGGMVSFVVSLYSGDGCLVGFVKTGQVANLPDTAALVSVEIVELLAALTADTTYVHSLKLNYVNDAHVWEASPRPAQTLSNLCAGTDTQVCSLNSLTVHTSSGMAGYSYSAGGQPSCGSAGGAGFGYIARNIFLGSDAQSGARSLSCGYTQPVGMTYDPIGPIEGGRHFYVEPTPDGYHLRQVSLDKNNTPMAGGTLSWGRFNNPLDSLTTLPSGYVIGVNRLNHKMEVLMLGSAAVGEPTAVPFATQKSGPGQRPGLLSTPVAVASHAGAVLVLEQGNARVQALDAHANPVNLFQDNTTNLMALRPEDGAVYLDLAVEGQGYMYVLSYLDNGTQWHQYRLDVYTPQGEFLCRTVGVAAARIAVDLFRNLYTLNFETLAGTPSPEPSLSQWLPVTPGACPASGAGAVSLACAATAAAL